MRKQRKRQRREEKKNIEKKKTEKWKAFILLQPYHLSQLCQACALSQ
jgi:hypothetical protein